MSKFDRLSDHLIQKIIYAPDVVLLIFSWQKIGLFVVPLSDCRILGLLLTPWGPRLVNNLISNVCLKTDLSHIPQELIN